jgi:hypothetical protein
MTKHLLSHDYPCFAIKSSRREIIALRKVSQGRGNRVLSSHIPDPNSLGLKQVSRTYLALSAWKLRHPGSPSVTHQLCAAHLLRDIEDAAQSYPAAIWPGQIADALRALIHAASLARDQGLAAVPDHDTAADLRLFRRGVRVGLSQVPRIPGAKVEQPPARLLPECLRDREDDVLRFLSDLRIPPTSNQAERDVRPAKISVNRPWRRLAEVA